MPHPSKVLSEMPAEEEELPSVNHQVSAEQIDIAHSRDVKWKS